MAAGSVAEVAERDQAFNGRGILLAVDGEHAALLHDFLHLPLVLVLARLLLGERPNEVWPTSLQRSLSKEV